MYKFAGRRELIELEVSGACVRGTVHHPWGTERDAAADTGHGGVAVLILNSLALPRAATGDSAVYWAESIAASGYPAIRIDLPGLGDSDGDASTNLLDVINSGTFAPAVAAIEKQLMKRNNYSGFVIMGHCAGSVTAIYSAAVSKQCNGLILMDPYFYLPVAKRSGMREHMSGFARSSKVGGILSNFYDLAKQLKLALREGSLPGNANVPLLNHWKHVAATGLPIILFKAPGIKATGAKPRTGEFDYIEHVMKLAGRKSQVVLSSIETADHSFASRDGREAIRTSIEIWMKVHFPLASAGRSLQSAPHEKAVDRQRPLEKVLVQTA